MALTFTHPDEAPGPPYVAPCRLYRTRDGRVVEDGDPDVHTLLVPAGGSLPLADAIRYGLVTLPEPDAAPVVEAPVLPPAPDPVAAVPAADAPAPAPAVEPAPEPATAVPAADAGTPPEA